MKNLDNFWPEQFFEELLTLLKSDEQDIGVSLTEICKRAAVETAADDILRPREAMASKLADQAAFETGIASRWGHGLDLAELVVSEAFDAGRWTNELMRPMEVTLSYQHKFEALVRLHGKAVLTGQEALHLLRGGFSTGALSRWRTIHEVWVITSILVEADEELCRRYWSHDTVERLSGQSAYADSWQKLNHEPPGLTEEERETFRTELKTEFGAVFVKPYGWAAPLFDGNAPKFRQLAKLAKLDHWMPYYRMASQGTHANAGGIVSNIQVPDESEMIVAGPSNSGLLDPAQCTLIGVEGVTTNLVQFAIEHLSETDFTTFDSSQFKAMLGQQRIAHLRDMAVKELVSIDSALKTEIDESSKLIARSKEIIGQTLRTAETLANEMDVDVRILSEALDKAAQNGDLSRQVSYQASDDVELVDEEE